MRHGLKQIEAPVSWSSPLFRLHLICALLSRLKLAAGHSWKTQLIVEESFDLTRRRSFRWNLILNAFETNTELCLITKSKRAWIWGPKSSIIKNSLQKKHHLQKRKFYITLQSELKHMHYCRNYHFAMVLRVYQHYLRFYVFFVIFVLIYTREVFLLRILYL